MPAGLIDQQGGVRAGCDGQGDLGEVQVHRGDVAAGQHQTGALAGLGANGAKDVGRCGALVVRHRWPRAVPGPAPGDLVLLAHPGFVGKPHFYAVRRDPLVCGDLCQCFGETFLRSSIAPAAWA